MQERGEEIKRIPTTGVVVFRQNPEDSEITETLLIRNGERAGHITNTYGTAGGRIEAGEATLDAAVRELQEETGLIANAEDLRKLDKIYDTDLPRKDGVLRVSHTVFVCTKFEGELTPEEDTSFPEWVDIRKINELNLGINIADMVSEAQKLLAQ